MIGRYDRIDSVDIIYRDKIYPNTYLLTGDDIMSDFEVDLEGDLDFNEMQTSNRRTICQLDNIYDLFDFMDAKGILYKSYCRTPDTLLVGGEKDCLIQPDLTFSWANEINACRKITSSRKFTKYPQGYVKANSDITYPWVTVEFHGEIKAYGSLKDDASLIKNIMEAMRRDDAFAKAMSDFYNPEYTTMEWDYSTYEEIAIGIVDFCKADYREWEALKNRGREDNTWAVISDDGSIVIS
jgi:hypothetical protein